MEQINETEITPSVMNIIQAAGYLKTTPRTMTRWVKEGMIPSVKVGGRRLFRKQHIDEALDRMAGIDSKAA